MATVSGLTYRGRTGMIDSCMRLNIPRLSSETLPANPNSGTWEATTPYLCNLGPGSSLPEPGDYPKQLSYAEKSAELVYQDMTSRGISEEDAKWVHSQMLARFNARVQDNNESMMSRDTSKDNCKDINMRLLFANKGRAPKGETVVGNLIEIREILDTGSIELGRVSAPSLNGRELYVEDMIHSANIEIAKQFNIDLISGNKSEDAVEKSIIERINSKFSVNI